MKKILLLLCFVLFAMIGFAQKPSAKTLIQGTVKAGNAFVVNVIINKCDLNIFAQYCIDIPQGFLASELSGQSDNANFYFENGKVIYQWYKLPIDRDEIQLSFSVDVPEGAKGNYSMPGFFSYSYNNLRAVIPTSLDFSL